MTQGGPFGKFWVGVQQTTTWGAKIVRDCEAEIHQRAAAVGLSCQGRMVRLGLLCISISLYHLCIVSRKSL